MKAPFTLACLFSSILLFAQSPPSPEDIEVKLEEIKKKEELKSLVLNLAKEYAIHFSLLTNAVVKAQEEASYWKDIAENTHAFYAEYIDSIEENNAQLNAEITALAWQVDQVRDSMENRQNEIILDLALGHEKSHVDVYDTAISAYEYGFIQLYPSFEELFYAKIKETGKEIFCSTEDSAFDFMIHAYPYPLVSEGENDLVVSFLLENEVCTSAGSLGFFRLQNDSMYFLGSVHLGGWDEDSYAAYSEYSFINVFDQGIPRLHCTTSEYSVNESSAEKRLLSTTESIYYFDGNKYSLLEE